MFMLPRASYLAADTPSLPRFASWSDGAGGYESFDGAAAAALGAGGRGDAAGTSEPELEVLVGAPEAVFDGIATDFEYPLRTRSSLSAYAPLKRSCSAVARRAR